MRAITLQDWVTVYADAAPTVGASVTTVTQTQSGWLDVSSFAGATFWIDMAEVVAPTGVSVSLTMQTSPTLDESYFQPAAPKAYPLLANQSPQTIQTDRTLGAAPLARYLRWQLATDHPSTSGAWGATFRIRVALSLESFFVPTDLSACVLWLRSDVGITLSGSVVSGWADQSGKGNNASQTNSGFQPTYTRNVMNGLPALEGNGSTFFMQTSAFTLGASATLFVAAQPQTTLMASNARLIEQQYNLSYYLGCDINGTKYQLIVDDIVSPFGTAVGGTVTNAANTIVSGVYTSPTGTLFVNGSSVGSGSFTAPSATNMAITIMQNYEGTSGPNTYWTGYFAEAIIYNRALATEEMTRVHRYLAGRYGVTM